MKLNRKWLLLVALVLSVAMATTGTLAYLTDDDADVNTMTLGSVKIVQNEHQRVVNEDGTYETATIDGVTSYVLEVYENDKPLLPATELDENGKPVNNGAGGWDENATVRMTQIGSYGGMDVFTSKNAVDKFVTVTNTGKSDAYVRTIIAFEAGSTDGSLVKHSNHFTWDTPETIGIVNIEGNNYDVWVYTYKGWEAGGRHVGGILPAGDTTYPSLCQVYLMYKADNEDIEALDGNGNGKLDILVLSQAVQSQGFEDYGAEVALNAGFGEPTAAAVQAWFGGWDEDDIGSPGDKWPNNDVPSVPDDAIVVDTVEELIAALKIKNAIVYVEGGTYDINTTFNIAEGVTVFGMNDSVVVNGTIAGTLNNVTMKNIHVESGNAQRWAYAKGTNLFENCTFEGTSVYALHFDGTAGSLTYRDCEIIGWVAMAGGADSILFDNCTVTGNGTYGVIRVYSDATIQDCTFDVDNVNTEDVYQDGVHAVGCTITMINCTNVNGSVEDLVNVSNDGVVNIQ